MTDDQVIESYWDDDASDEPVLIFPVGPALEMSVARDKYEKALLWDHRAKSAAGRAFKALAVAKEQHDNARIESEAAAEELSEATAAYRKAVIASVQEGD